MCSKMIYNDLVKHRFNYKSNNTRLKKSHTHTQFSIDFNILIVNEKIKNIKLMKKFHYSDRQQVN